MLRGLKNCRRYLSKTRQFASFSGASSDPLDRLIQEQLRHVPTPNRSTYELYRRNAGVVLPAVLPYESYPKPARRVDPRQHAGVVRVVHAAQAAGLWEFVVCSGFAVDVGSEEDCCVVSCAHTLEQIESQYPKVPKTSFILVDDELVPITDIPSSNPRLDVILCQVKRKNRLLSLPVTPFPIYHHQKILTHSYTVGERWADWIPGRMLGYRGYRWEEVEPGTASTLPYMLFSTLPTGGSSGGPIVDKDSGAIIGMISGRRMDNRVEGERGWGTSAEGIFEMFSLPGFTLASKRKG